MLHTDSEMAVALDAVAEAVAELMQTVLLVGQALDRSHRDWQERLFQQIRQSLDR
jgi:2-keto-4-pentenoate hydratase/2-oxohepta-3-ene-1,7-dioic acid hydratase in catechol pathway